MKFKGQFPFQQIKKYILDGFKHILMDARWIAVMTLVKIVERLLGSISAGENPVLQECFVSLLELVIRLKEVQEEEEGEDDDTEDADDENADDDTDDDEVLGTISHFLVYNLLFIIIRTECLFLLSSSQLNFCPPFVIRGIKYFLAQLVGVFSTVNHFVSWGLLVGGPDGSVVG